MTNTQLTSAINREYHVNIDKSYLDEFCTLMHFLIQVGIFQDYEMRYVDNIEYLQPMFDAKALRNAQLGVQIKTTRDLLIEFASVVVNREQDMKGIYANESLAATYYDYKNCLLELESNIRKYDKETRYAYWAHNTGLHYQRYSALRQDLKVDNFNFLSNIGVTQYRTWDEQVACVGGLSKYIPWDSPDAVNFRLERKVVSTVEFTIQIERFIPTIKDYLDFQIECFLCDQSPKLKSLHDQYQVVLSLVR